MKKEGIMRLAVINCIFLALTGTALAEEPRPRRHLNQIINKLFGSCESNCTQPAEAPPAPLPLETKFFKIPGFNNVVIKAVPKGSNPEPAPVYEEEELPPNSHIGVVASYLGTNTLNETYTALLGVKNLLTSGILTAKRDVLREFTLPHPPKVQFISPVLSKLVKPCAAPGLSHLPVEPVRVIVRPPKIPVASTQYSYKQVNQDGSLTSYTSALDLKNGVRVIEDGRTLPFFIDRVQKLPVRLPVPVLPEISKIIVAEAVHPTTYSYQQINQDGRMTSYMGLPSLVSMPGPVVVTETIKKIPPPPVYLMDRIENVAAIASFPRAPLLDAESKPAVTGHVPKAPVKESPVSKPGLLGYSYSQMTENGGITTHSASGAHAEVLVTENELPAAPLHALPNWPEKNSFGPPRGYGFSYSQVQGGGQTPSFHGLGNQAGSVNVIEHRPSPPRMPLPPNSFSYKQIGDGKMITYTGSDIIEESHGANSAVGVHRMNHPVPPPHITDRIEKIAAGAKFNRPPYSTPFAVQIPTGFVHVPSVHTLVPQRPVKIPNPSRPSSFIYKHIHSDGSMTSYGGEGFVEDGKAKLPPPADMAKPFPQGNIRIVESDNGPFPMNPVNPNAIKPSTPVSGSYSYKMVNHPPIGPIDEPIVDTFAPPPPLPSMPAPIQGCVNPDVTNPAGYIANPLVQPAVLFEKPIPLTYSYKQISHNNPNPFLVVNVEDPVMDVKNVEMKLSHDNHAYAYPALPLPPLPAQFTPVENSPDPSFSYKQVTSQAYLPQPPVPAFEDINAPAPPFSYKQVTSQAYLPQPPVPAFEDINSPAPSFSYKQVTSQAYLPQPPVPAVEDRNSPAPSFSYKQVTSQAYLPQPPVPAFKDIEHSQPSVIALPQRNYVPSTNVQIDTSPSSSFSYKQVINQALPPLPSPPRPTANVMEHKPDAVVQPMQFLPPQNSDMHLKNVPKSFSYKQVTGQENQPHFLSPQHADDDAGQRLSAPPVPPPMINSRAPEIQKDSAPSSFSYKQVTNQGVYEYADEFPTGIKTNLHSIPVYPRGNPSGDVYVEQKPLPNPSIPMTFPASLMPIPSRPKPTFERRNSLSNNPIVVPEQTSFSFKSSNSDGSTITVKNGGHNSVAVELEEAPKGDLNANSQEPAIPAPPAPIVNEPQRTESAFVNESTAAPLPKKTQGPMSGHAKPLRRRVIKRVKSVKQHRGDIPDTE